MELREFFIIEEFFSLYRFLGEEDSLFYIEKGYFLNGYKWVM